MFYHIPTNLVINLKEAAAELDFDGSFVFYDDSWTVLYPDGKIAGWFYFDQQNNYTDIEVMPASKNDEIAIRRVFSVLNELMSESVGQDQCKTGKCAT